ncbi:MAG: Mn-dependent transcriptional regulator MntR, partial [uncultured Rubrobacteraceae bacterium]
CLGPRPFRRTRGYPLSSADPYLLRSAPTWKPSGRRSAPAAPPLRRSPPGSPCRRRPSPTCSRACGRTDWSSTSATEGRPSPAGVTRKPCAWCAGAGSSRPSWSSVSATRGGTRKRNSEETDLSPPRKGSRSAWRSSWGTRSAIPTGVRSRGPTAPRRGRP